MGHRREAIRALLKRYWIIIREAWVNRASLTPPKRTDDENAFQPAAVALRDTPPHPAPRITSWIIVSTVTFTIAWATIAELDVIAVAEGTILPNQRTMNVQPLETSIVKAISVRNGDLVRKGQKLVELEPTLANADLAQLRGEILDNQLAITRAEALLGAVRNGTEPAAVAMPIGDRNRAQLEERLLFSELEEYFASQKQLDAALNETLQERFVIETQIERYSKLIPIIQQRLADYSKLLSEGHVSKHDVLKLEQESTDIAGELSSHEARVLELDASISGRRLDIAHARAAFLRHQEANVVENTKRLDALNQQLQKAIQRTYQTTLISPADGVVQELSVHNTGAVIREAEKVLAVVPSDALLEIEAKILNRDVGFVREGQSVQVKLDAFTFTKYGTIDGFVESISADAIQDERLGLIYLARIRLADQFIAVGDKSLSLIPGMSVINEIRTDKRRVVDYFLGPLKTYSSQSLRER